jgi:hypothetical protein
MRVGTLAIPRAAVCAPRVAPPPRREPTASTAADVTKLNMPNTANGANTIITRPISSGHARGSQIVSMLDSPFTISARNPIVRGPVRSRATTAET